MTKLLWIDNEVNDEIAQKLFMEEWSGVVPHDDILLASTEAEALHHLAKNDDVVLAIIDLLWPGEPEHEKLIPTGVDIVRSITKAYPRLMLFTRSKVSDAQTLRARMAEVAACGITTHFTIGVNETETQRVFRKQLLWEGAKRAGARREKSLEGHLGEQWGVVVFADVSGFTSATEKMFPNDRDRLVRSLQRFYESAGRVVSKHGGIVDKLIGDEVMAVFLAPNQKADQSTAQKAIDAAVEVRNEFLTLSHEHKRDATPDQQRAAGTWEVKIGVEAGALFITTHRLPSEEVEICTIGMAVNLASRIKGVIGRYAISIGPGIRSVLPGGVYATKAHEKPIDVPGFSAPIQVYRLEDEDFIAPKPKK